jgi:hypothetical protein
MHDGSAPTLKEAILKHRGQAKTVSEKYKALSPGDQSAILAFLAALKAPPDAPQLRDPATTKLSRK